MIPWGSRWLADCHPPGSPGVGSNLTKPAPGRPRDPQVRKAGLHVTAGSRNELFLFPFLLFESLIFPGRCHTVPMEVKYPWICAGWGCVRRRGDFSCFWLLTLGLLPFCREAASLLLNCFPGKKVHAASSGRGRLFSVQKHPPPLILAVAPAALPDPLGGA